jgi:transmembrane sensor
VNSRRDDVIEEAVAQQATEWLTAHRQGDLSARERSDYLQWLKASPRHIEAYLKLVEMTGKLPEAFSGLDLDLDELVREAEQARTAAVYSPFPDRVAAGGAEVPRARRRPVLVAAFVFAVAVAVGLAAFLNTDRTAGARTVTVPADQQRTITLEDGSVARLDSNTKLRIVFSHTRRLIELSEGQGLFTVMHDARRPFIVRAAGQDIVALGTQFDVSHRNQHIEVTVVEGRIEIIGMPAEQAVDAPRSSLPAPTLQLGAGQQVHLSDGGTLSPPMLVDAAAATAWTERVVSFADSSLESVAAGFSRHTGARISIEDASLRDYKVNGVFQAYDLESFVGYLEQLPGVVVTRGPNDELRVLRRAPR